MSRVSSEIWSRSSARRSVLACDRRPRRPRPPSPSASLHPRRHLHLVGAGDRVLEVLALLDEAADADHRHRREHGESRSRSRSAAGWRAMGSAVDPLVNMLARRWGTRLQAAATAPRRRRDGIDAAGSKPGSPPTSPARARRCASSGSPAATRTSPTGSPTPAGSSWALRRPPLGKRLGSAHDMAREHKVVSALGDDRGAGRAGGRALRGRERQRRALLRDGVRRGAGPARARRGRRPSPTRATGGRSASASPTPWSAIHAVDPDAVGLGDLGRKEDYVARQLHRWQGQWEKSKTRELPAIDRVHERLAARIPEQGPATIVHGDYRLDNMILTDSGEVAAVVDWELCTLGDPLADVGLLMAYWPDRGEAEIAPRAARQPGARLPDPRGARPPATPSAPAATSPTSTSSSPSATGSWRSSSRASTPATPPAATARSTPASTPSPAWSSASPRPPRRSSRAARPLGGAEAGRRPRRVAALGCGARVFLGGSRCLARPSQARSNP